MLGVNKVILVGYLGGDPEKRKAGQSTVVSFTLATSKKIKDKTITVWHNIIVWNKLGDLAIKYLNKGDPVYLEGEITTNKWTDKEKINRERCEIVVNTLQFMKGKNK